VRQTSGVFAVHASVNVLSHHAQKRRSADTVYRFIVGAARACTEHLHIAFAFAFALLNITAHNMTQYLYIITGASRGMGFAMAEQLLTPENQLLCISRKTNDALVAVAQERGATIEQWAQDLSDGAAASARLHAWLSALDASKFKAATLINNAAIVPAVVPLREISYSDIAVALRVGLEAPMQLTAAFLNATQQWRGIRKVLNISSGNGRRAMASQASYSAVKAGMDHYSRVVAIEEAAKTNGAKICSLAPGIIDTDMQTQLRNADPTSFPDQAVFIDYKNNGDLLSPDAAAKRVLSYLMRADFGANPVADVRDK
jgi:benzil reductase ((S)-benzoin forming)